MNMTKWIALLGMAALGLTGCPDDDTDADGGGTAGGSSGTTEATAADDAMTGAVEGGDSSSGGNSGGSSSGGGSTDEAGSETGIGESEGSGDGSSSGSGSDDGGSSSSDDGGKVEECEAPGDLVTCDDWGSGAQWWQVLGLGCEGGINEVIPVQGTGFASPDPNGWALVTGFGTYEEAPGQYLWAPIEGEQMLVLSSGQAGVPDANGHVTFASLNLDSNGNPDDKPLPAPMSPQPGSGGAPFTGCDGVNDCSDSLITQWNAGGQGANDLVWLQFASQVPGGTHGFAFDFAYFSEEFPEWVGTTFNDMFIVWSNSETYTGNLCFIDDQPCTVTALWPTQFQPGAVELAQTGFTNDGATGWFQLKGSAEPGELLELTIAVFDMGDTGWDTLVLLDHFAWDCEGCTPSEVNPCGVIDPT